MLWGEDLEAVRTVMELSVEDQRKCGWMWLNLLWLLVCVCEWCGWLSQMLVEG